MKKIQFLINDNTLTIGYKIENNAFKNLNNTNIISKDDLIFDTKYFKNNLKLVAGFLNVMVKNDNITKAIVDQEELIITSLELLNYIPTITDLIIKPDISIDYEMHLAILKNDTLRYINLYAIPTYLLERIDTTKGVKIETRVEVFYISNFLRVNKLTSYSDVFYKRKIVIDYEFKDLDYKDFDQFLSINNYLKTIYFEYIDMDFIKSIVRHLKEAKKKSITLTIKGTENNLSYFLALEEFAKKSKYIKQNKIKFKIDYTKEYKFENFMKLLNFTTLKYMLVVIIFSCIIGYGLNEYDIYMSSTEIDSINDDISDLLEEFEYLDPNPPTEPTTTPTTPSPEPTAPTKTKTKNNYLIP